MSLITLETDYPVAIDSPDHIAPAGTVVDNRTDKDYVRAVKNYFGDKLKILDMGCGTGILAILAAMKGADSITAIDIDEWAYLNTIENTLENNCGHIVVKHGGVELFGNDSFDFVFANINLNILLNDMSWGSDKNRHPIKIVYEIKRDPILKDFIKKLENFVCSSHEIIRH